MFLLKSATPFGSPMSNRGFSAQHYRYGFNGKEKDKEVQGNAYDFGARIYDSRLGKWMSIDPFTDKNPTYSGYTFSDDNPIIFIDHGGLYRMSARMQRKYPELTNLLKNISQKVHSDPTIYDAFKNTLGLTDDQANEILEWGKGPKVRVGFVWRAFAVTSVRTGNIKLWGKMVKAFEKGESKYVAEAGLEFLVFITVLHEGQHTAEVEYNKTLLKPGESYDASSNTTEAGNVFEQSAIGEIINTENADRKALENAIKPNASELFKKHQQEEDEGLNDIKVPEVDAKEEKGQY